MTQVLTSHGNGVCKQILERVADLENTDPTALPPLFDAIEPEALEALFAPTERSEKRSGQVVFSYYGYTVIVEVDSDVAIHIN